jgi:oxalate decarboxylase/phosphoglucose isomerase-like protein (cupin superfamily)
VGSITPVDAVIRASTTTISGRLQGKAAIVTGAARGIGRATAIAFAMAHYVQNLGHEPLRFLEMFRSARFADVSLSQWMALTPPELVQAHLNLDLQTISALRRDKPIIVK